MHISDLFWLFFIFSALQPVLRQQMLDAMRTRKIAQLERKRNSRVILLVHRQETMRFLGFPVGPLYRHQRLRRCSARHPDDGRRRATRHGSPHPGRPGPGGAPNRASRSRPQSQGHSLRAALRHVRRHPHRAGGRRDRHVQALRSWPYRSAARRFACRVRCSRSSSRSRWRKSTIRP